MLSLHYPNQQDCKPRPGPCRDERAAVDAADVGIGAEGVTFVSCDVAEAVRIGLEAAGGKNLEVFSARICRQLLERGLIDEIDLHT